MSSRGPNPSEEQVSRVHDALARARGPLTLSRLIEDSSVPERLARECVAQLVRSGVPIVSLGQGCGYELTRDPEKIRAEIAYIDSYVDSLRARSRGLALNLPTQETLFS